MGPAEMIIGVSVMSATTVVPKVMNRLIAIGNPQMTRTFAFLCRMIIASATNARLAGSIVSTNSRYISSEMS